jgi:hypothetical protein
MKSEDMNQLDSLSSFHDKKIFSTGPALRQLGHFFKRLAQSSHAHLNTTNTRPK